MKRTFDCHQLGRIGVPQTGSRLTHRHASLCHHGRGLGQRQPWAKAQGEYLAQMMPIEVLRLHMTDKMTGGVGWLFALANKQLSAALAVMHERPGHRWVVQDSPSVPACCGLPSHYASGSK